MALLGRRRRGVRAEVGIEQEPTAPGSDEDVDDEEVRLLYACIRELCELDRAIVLLHLEKHTYEEIAEALGWHERSVRRAYQKILGKVPSDEH